MSGLQAAFRRSPTVCKAVLKTALHSFLAANAGHPQIYLLYDFIGCSNNNLHISLFFKKYLPVRLVKTSELLVHTLGL